MDFLLQYIFFEIWVKLNIYYENYKKFIQTMLISVLFISFTSCSDDDEDNNVNDTDIIDFTIQPLADLDQIVTNTPNDFTWGFYEDNLSIGLSPEP